MTSSSPRSPSASERASDRYGGSTSRARPTDLCAGGARARANTLYRMTPVKCRSFPPVVRARRLSDEACKELGYTRTRGTTRVVVVVGVGCARIPSRAKSHDKYTHVWRSTIITIGSEDEEGARSRRVHPPRSSRKGTRREEEEGGGGLAGNRYIHTRNRVTLLGEALTRRTHVHTGAHVEALG